MISTGTRFCIACNKEIIEREVIEANGCGMYMCPFAKPSPPARDPLLVERERTHGDFKKSAEAWQKLMNIAYTSRLNDSQKLALAMIDLKKVRILFGDPMDKEHWLDIAGYAKLGAEACD